jgi:hypothetical protein
VSEAQAYLYREHGQWYISIETERWVVDEITKILMDGGRLGLASSSFVSGSGPDSRSSLLIVVNPGEPPVTIEKAKP